MNQLNTDFEAVTQPLNVPSTIVERRTIRQFLNQPIAPELLKQLMELTVAAPTSWNLQDWSAVLVEGEQRTALAKAAFGQRHILEAPVTVVFVADPNTAWKRDFGVVAQQARQKGAWSDEFITYFQAEMQAFQNNLKANGKTREYAIKDAMIAATHLVLAANSMGLAASFLNGWEEEKVKTVVGISEEELAIAVLVAVGYPAEQRLAPGRLPLEERVFIGNFTQPYAD